MVVDKGLEPIEDEEAVKLHSPKGKESENHARGQEWGNKLSLQMWTQLRYP